MRWLKHMTSSWDDEKISAIVDELGLEGYGFWWRILEIIATQLDENSNTSCEYSAKKWGSFFNFSAKKFEKFAKIFQNSGILQAEFFENSIRISIPNLLKYRDEWTKKKSKNSRVTPEELRRKESDTESDTEEDIKKEDSASCDAAFSQNSDSVSAENSNAPGEAEKPCDSEKPETSRKSSKKSGQPPDEPHYRTKSGRYLTGKRLNSFNRFWQGFDFARGKAEAADAWADIPQLTEQLVDKICAAARQEAAERPQLEAKGQTPKWAQGWINARRWEDYEPIAKARDPTRHVSDFGGEFDPVKHAKAQELRKRLEAERRVQKEESNKPDKPQKATA